MEGQLNEKTQRQRKPLLTVELNAGWGDRVRKNIAVRQLQIVLCVGGSSRQGGTPEESHI